MFSTSKFLGLPRVTVAASAIDSATTVVLPVEDKDE